MSNKWFRFYDDALNDPKVQSLDGDTFKAWVNLLCIASKNGGRLGSISEIAFHLRCDDNGALTLVERLLNATLIDRVNGGANGYGYTPHGWEKRQYKSDSSSERVKRYRNVTRNVTETPPDTDTDTDKKEVDAVVNAGANSDSDSEAAHRKLYAATASRINEVLSRFARVYDCAPVHGWLKAGADPDLDILPTIERIAASVSITPKTLKYFESAVLEAIAQRNRIPSLPEVNHETHQRNQSASGHPARGNPAKPKSTSDVWRDGWASTVGHDPEQ